MRSASADGYSEVSPAKERGKFVAMNHVGFVVGLAVGLWYAPSAALCFAKHLLTMKGSATR